MKKHTAPIRVCVLARAALCTCPVSGLTWAATADTPKATDPARLASVIHHDHSFVRQAAQPWQTSYQARKLETRKQTEPTAWGRYTCWWVAWADRLAAVAVPVLTLKNTVPTSCTPVAHQSIRPGW
jgi:hypothetical protein